MISDIRPAPTTTTTRDRPANQQQFRRGFLAVVPLWPGVVSFSVAFAVLARAAGYSAVETQLMSMFVFAGSAQLAMVTLAAGGAGALAIVLTALVLNLRHILYGLSVDRRIDRGERPSRLVQAFFLTDESFGLSTREWLAGRGSAAFLFGTGIGLYACFTIGTLAGLLFGSLIPGIETSGIDFIFPLSFLALLLPLLRSRIQFVVAIVSAIIALIAGQFLSGGITILLATIVAALAGVWLNRREGHA